MKVLEHSQTKLPLWTRIAFAGRHGIVLCYYINLREGGVERWLACDEPRASFVPVLDLTLMSERGVKVQSGCECMEPIIIRLIKTHEDWVSANNYFKPFNNPG